MANMAAIRRGRTLISIAHRLNTLREADRILVMEAGQIVESGSHDELLAARGSMPGCGVSRPVLRRVRPWLTG